MFKDDRARKAGWSSLRMIGAIGVAVVAMTSDANIDARGDGRDVMRTNARAVGPWCMLDRDSRRNCGYLTFDQCLRVGDPIGSTCRPDPGTALIADDAPYRTYRSIYPDDAGQRL